MRHRPIPLILLLATGALGATPPADFLKGPDFTSAPEADAPASEPMMARPSLVEPTFDGRQVQLDERPEIAAVRLLDLTESEQTAVDDLLEQRAIELDRLVRENLDLVVGSATVSELAGPGAQEARRENIRNLARAFRPIIQKGSLKDQISAALSPEHQADYIAIVDEYHAATSDKTANRRQNAVRQALQGLGQEIKASYERTLLADSDRLEEWLASLDIDEPTREKIRNVFRDAVTLGERPTDAERQQTIRKALELLPPDVRRKTIADALRDRQRGL